MDLQPPPIQVEGRKNGPIATKIFLCLSFLCALFAVFLLIKVVPTFKDVFDSFGGQLPWLTTLVIGLSQGLRNPLGYNAALLVLLLFIVFSVRMWEIMPPMAALGILIGWLFFSGGIVAALFWPMFTLGNAKG